jgi:RimJ/RimL family protein N-acetyltransferase
MWAPCGPSGGAVPELSGKLCRLRPLTKSDAAVTLAWRQDAETRELVMGYRLPVTEASEAAWYEQVINDRSGKRASFAIEAQSGKLVGIVHLMEIDAFSQSAKFGIVIGDKSERRKGFGAEATMLLLRYAFGTLNLHRIELQVLASNTAAVRLYEALGFITEGRSREAHFLHGRFVDVLVMGLLRHEFKDIPAADPRYRY